MIRFLVWHYTKALSTLIKIITNLFYFLFHFFSVPNLLKTLISPWKRQAFKYDIPGLHLEKVFEVLVLNIISSVIGLIIRTTTIFFWLFSNIAIIIISSTLLLLFLIFPPLTIPSYVSYKRKKQNSLENILIKYGTHSKNLFNQIFSKKLSDFIYQRLEIPLNEYAEIFQKQNSPEEELAFQNSLKTITPTLESIAEIFAKFYSPLSQLLENRNISESDFLNVVAWQNRQENENNGSFFELKNLQKIKSVGKNWAYGYTINLDKFSTDLNAESIKSSHLVGRNKEIENIERILSKTGENNVLLVGEPGVGKKTIIYGLAKRIAEDQTTPELSHKRVLMFDINSLLGGETSIEGKRSKLTEILKEAKEAGNIILAIPDFDKYVSEGPERINLTESFAENISGSELLVIGITTPKDYHRYISPDAAILKLVEEVEVFPPTTADAIIILEDLTPYFENKQKNLITFFAIKEIVSKSGILITDVPFPEKAINLLDESIFYSKNVLKTKLITKEGVDKLLSEKTKIPLTSLTEEEKEKLLDLEVFLHKKIVDQEVAISEISKAMKRGRLKISSTNKPIGSFLFLGPTGVGKTETAKALANLYFGSDDKLIRFDMAEFIGTNAIEKLIGSPDGKPGLLTTAVKDNPFSVLLLDEFEKTTPDILNLFLTVFDEGYLKDIDGKQISFTNLIIIATSNAAAEFIREKVQNRTPAEQLSKELINYLLEERIFNPEFINRFDNVIFFKPLEYAHLKEIAKIMLNSLNIRLKEEHNITVKITDLLIHFLATVGYSDTFGARPMKRLIQDKVEFPIAQMLLEGKITKGEEVEINI